MSPSSDSSSHRPPLVGTSLKYIEMIQYMVNKYNVVSPELTKVHGGKPSSLPLVEVTSPLQSDEEYLSPLEEVMEIGEPPSRGVGPQSKYAFFKDPPSFQVKKIQRASQ